MMNFVACTNIATALFCAAVLIQSVRMMRSLKAMRRRTGRAPAGMPES